MKQRLIKTAVHFLPKSVVARIERPWKDQLKLRNNSFSQNGEDIILQRLFSNRNSGFFVDIGAHHPVRFSNTYCLYLKGWRGLNIDAMPGSMAEFRRLRPADTNLEIGVGREEQEVDFYIFNEPALNTFNKTEATQKDGLYNYKIQEIVKLRMRPLGSILREYLPPSQSIDYLNIDVEGLDMEVLTSNDWKSFCPSVISVEWNGKSKIQESQVYNFLKGTGYELVSVLFNTLIFIRNDFGADRFIRI